VRNQSKALQKEFYYFDLIFSGSGFGAIFTPGYSFDRAGGVRIAL
jgi:hypothetical protein